MPSGWWDEYRAPLPADGIKARTQRGKFGKTWWAGRWLATLERICGEGRLTRGRSYARRGQVISLDVAAAGVEAAVQGSRSTPYSVSISLRRLSDTDWERVLDAMAARALYAAKLLAGEMPEQIEEVFTAVGASLLPASSRDLITHCSCPDSANPCKHVAAVYYLLGERFDEDPFLMFALRGRTSDAVLADLRLRRGEVASPAEGTTDTTEAAQGEAATPLAEISADIFWLSPSGLPALAFSFEPPEIDALAVKRLGPPPFASAAGFAGLMERCYRAIARHARELALGGRQDDR